MPFRVMRGTVRMQLIDLAESDSPYWSARKVLRIPDQCQGTPFVFD